MPHLRVREVVPRELYPNFRDHGRMVDRALLKVIASNQRKFGECYASEAGLREMVCEETGHMPGVNTIPTAIERLKAEGILSHEWLKPGGLLPDGSPCTLGTRITAVAANRAQQLAIAARAKSQSRREGITGRVDRKALAALQTARANVARFRAVAPVRDGSLDRAKERELARLRDLEAQWAAAAAPAREPDKPPE